MTDFGDGPLNTQEIQQRLDRIRDETGNINSGRWRSDLADELIVLANDIDPTLRSVEFTGGTYETRRLASKP